MLLAALLTARTSAAAVDDAPAGLLPTAATLAKVRAVYLRSHDHERGRLATIIEEWRLTQDKMSGTLRVYRLGRDERDLTLLGPLQSESGVHNGTRWQQTRNGMTYTYAGVHEGRDALSERVWLSDTEGHDVRLLGESPTLNAFVVELDPPGGRHEWLFIDKRAGTLVRREYVEKQRRYAVTFDDYRTFDGIAEPSRVRITDSYGNERDLSLLSRTLDLTPDPHDVDIPPSRRTLVEFPNNVTNVHLPMRVVNGLCVVKVRVGSRDYDFLLDSGAAGIVIDPMVTDDAHIDTFGTRVGATIGTFTETTAVVPQMNIGRLRMRSVVSRVVSIPFHLDEHTRIAGLLGFDFFLDTVVHVDFDHSVASVIAPGSFKPPPDAIPLPLALDDRTPVVRAHQHRTRRPRHRREPLALYTGLRIARRRRDRSVCGNGAIPRHGRHGHRRNRAPEIVRHRRAASVRSGRRREQREPRRGRHRRHGRHRLAPRLRLVFRLPLERALRAPLEALVSG
jgi:Aspartyl protease